MKLLEKYKNEFAPILGNKTLASLLSTIEIADPFVDDLSSLDPKRTICIGKKTPVGDALECFQKYKIEHFVQVDRDGFINDLFAAALILQKPAAFMNNPMPFFISSLKSSGDTPASPVRSISEDFSSSKDKPKILDAVRDFLEGHRKTCNFIETVHMMADELMMNAMFNAPVDSHGKPKYLNTDRAVRVDYDPDKTGKIFVTHDDRRLLIGCEDPFGSVIRFRLIQRLMKAYKDGGNNASPSLEEGGAGLGCKMMIDSGCGFYMMVKQNEKTLACCALPLGVSYIKAERMSKNIHLVFF